MNEVTGAVWSVPVLGNSEVPEESFEIVSEEGFMTIECDTISCLRALQGK